MSIVGDITKEVKSIIGVSQSSRESFTTGEEKVPSVSPPPRGFGPVKSVGRYSP